MGLRVFTGHASSVTSVAFSPDGEHMLTGSEDSTDPYLGSADRPGIVSLISFRDGNWAVVDREGRFDAANLDEVKGDHWVMPDDPFTPLPPEIFMRDYYEPRLLAHSWPGKGSSRSAIFRALTASSLSSESPRSKGSLAILMNICSQLRSLTRSATSTAMAGR